MLKSLMNLLGLLIVLLSIAGCSNEPVINKIAGPTMGTQYHISWVSDKRGRALEAEASSIQKSIDSLLVDINKSMSTYDPKSELSQINTVFNPDWQDISPDLYRVMMMAMQVHVNSRGAFDITIGPLVNLWGFGPSGSKSQAANSQVAKSQVPGQEAINAQLQRIGSDAINLRQRDEGFQLQLKQARYIDLSAIAKGYAVDVLARYLSSQGIDSYLVEVGGEIFARGQKATGVPWRIAIEAPNDASRNAQLIIPLSNLGIATSGDYRNFFQQDGKRFSHTLDGRTGYPVDHGLASVSVLHESVAMADAWATALTVLGAQQGVELANELELAAFFIERTDDGFKQTSSRQFERLRLN
jgi:thiamine biosynthesis lipoprotein